LPQKTVCKNKNGRFGPKRHDLVSEMLASLERDKDRFSLRKNREGIHSGGQDEATAPNSVRPEFFEAGVTSFREPE
jgi:hypothetical protein